jgi:hypothetical protein
MMKRTLFTSLAAATISSLAIVAPATLTPAAARASFNMSIGAPAPAYYDEPVPASRYVWAPGYGRWERYHHGWQHGRWERDHYRHGYRHGWNHRHR